MNPIDNELVREYQSLNQEEKEAHFLAAAQALGVVLSTPLTQDNYLPKVISGLLEGSVSVVKSDDSLPSFNDFVDAYNEKNPPKYDSSKQLEELIKKRNPKTWPILAMEKEILQLRRKCANLQKDLDSYKLAKTTKPTFWQKLKNLFRND